MRHLAFALLLAASAAAQPNVPDTSAGRVFAAWLAAFNSGDLAQVRAFDATYRREGGPPVPPAEATVNFRAQTGGFTLIRIEKQDPTTIVALLQERESDMVARIEMSLTAGDPPKITGSSLRAIPRPADLAIPRMSEAEALAALGRRVDELTAADRFSGVIVIARRGKVLFERASGRANRETNAPVTTETQFRIGSMNKMFTSIAILQLVQAGKLSLDDPIGKHLTDYPNRSVATKVTIRHLLTHTGGTGDIFGPEFTKNRLTLREHGDYVKLYGARDLTHEAGAQFRYSNYGFVLLGAIVERVTGMTYHDAVRRNVFERAGMTSTDSRPESESVPQRSAGYMRRGDGWVSNAETLPWRGTAAGGGYSTAGDLLRFAQALEAGTLVSKAMLAQATTPQRDDYGYGFNARGTGALRSYGHGGGAPGMNGELRVYPELGYVIVGLSNFDPPAASRPIDFFMLRMPVPATTADVQQPRAVQSRPAPSPRANWRPTPQPARPPSAFRFARAQSMVQLNRAASASPSAQSALATRSAQASPGSPSAQPAPTPRSPQASPTSQPTQPPPGTDIWLARLTPKGLEQPINITNRPGYDNQPSFTPDGKGMLFTRSDGTQTDIYLYDFTSRGSEPTRVTNTPESEYSPTVTPDQEGISVIRVEADGTQRLWRFTRDGQSPTIVLRDVKPVGYHAWGPDGQLALYVLGARTAEGRPPNPSTLHVADSRTGRARVVAQRVGRSLHRIPGRDTISVLHIEGDVRTIKELDVKARALKPIVRALESSDGDYTWTPDGAILMSDGKMLMRAQGNEWSPVADLAALGLAGASRMAVSPDGRWLALVTPDPPGPQTKD